MAWYNNLFFSGKKKTEPVHLQMIELPKKQLGNPSLEKFHSIQKGQGEDLSTPYISELYAEYVYFGNDNLYPNLLNNLFYSSPFHASIIKFKSQHLVGNGYTLDTSKLVSEKQKIEAKQMEAIFNQEFMQIMAMDFNIHNRLTWKVYWNQEHTKIINIERIEPAKVRSQKKVNGKVQKYVINNDWTLRLSNNTIKEYIPAFDKFNKNETVQLWVYSPTSPGLDYYSLPDYVAATNWIFLDSQMSYYQKSNIENSINPSVIMKFYEKPANNEEQENFIRNLKKSFTGAKNAGKVLTFFANSKEEAPDIQTIDANPLDEAFVESQENVIKNISFAHNVSPIIMGLAQPGSLGAGTELETSYKIFNNTYCEPNQRLFNRILKDFFGYNNLNVDVKMNQVNTLD
jgi:hypothetical protein